MKNSLVIALVGAIVGLNASFALSGDNTPASCIPLWSENRGIESLAPNATLVERATRDQLTGAMTQLVAYVEQRDVTGRLTIDAIPQQMYVFPTAGGQYVVRFVEGPVIPAWYYGYIAPF
jgi:hypothetical protein